MWLESPSALNTASFDNCMNCFAFNTGMVLAASWKPALDSIVTRALPARPRFVEISTTPLAPREP